MNHNALIDAFKIHRPARGSIGSIVGNDRKGWCLIFAFLDFLSKLLLFEFNLRLQLLDSRLFIFWIELRGSRIIETLQASHRFLELLLESLDMVLGASQLAAPQLDLPFDLFASGIELLGDRDQIVRLLLGLLDRFAQLRFDLFLCRGSRIRHVDNKQ